MPKTLPEVDLAAPFACAPLAAGAVNGETAVQVAVRLKALADPVRVRIMSLLLASGDEGICTCDLAPAVGLTDATVSHHLKQLRESGFVVGTRDGMNVYYRAVPSALAALCRVIDPECC